MKASEGQFFAEAGSTDDGKASGLNCLEHEFVNHPVEVVQFGFQRLTF
jgi:hypothetical protein